MADDDRLTLGDLLRLAREAAHVLEEEYNVRTNLSRRLARLLSAVKRGDDRLAEIQHEAWMRAKAELGYHHPLRCQGRDGRCVRCSALMLPWADLDDGEKAVRRAMAAALRANILNAAEPRDELADDRRAVEAAITANPGSDGDSR